MTLQIVRDRVVRFNDRRPGGLLDGKVPGIAGHWLSVWREWIADVRSPSIKNKQSFIIDAYGALLDIDCGVTSAVPAASQHWRCLWSWPQVFNMLRSAGGSLFVSSLCTHSKATAGTLVGFEFQSPPR
ncbi:MULTISPECIES: hypothetical protein [Sphingobium]|uniref:hypothetical protein n=1 Tax=Sphingobium TaxID=165695 RepID=UPI00159C1E90|nr:hypothetical protein [Sphingobium sp. 15-1]